MRRLEWLPGTFACFTGYLRAGKTMCAVMYAGKLYNQGWNIVSNISITFASQRLVTLEDLLAVRNSVILWDEAQATLDSREFGKNVNVTQEGILFGKRGNIVLMTMPNFGMLDLRFRQLTSYVFMCQKVRKSKRWASYVQVMWYPQVGNTLQRVTQFTMWHEPLYGLYDTYDENVALLPAVSVNHDKKAASVAALAKPSSNRAAIIDEPVIVPVSFARSLL